MLALRQLNDADAGDLDPMAIDGNNFFRHPLHPHRASSEQGSLGANAALVI